MGSAVRVCLVLALFAASACGAAPSAPTAPPAATTPTASAAASRYSLVIDVSPSCPNTGNGSMWVRSFTFKMRALSQDPADSAFQILNTSTPGTPLAANTGDIRLDLGSSSLSGGGMSDNNSSTAAFFATGSPRQGTSALRVIGSGPNGESWGTLDGFMTFSIYRTAGGGECGATGHTWHLTPEG